MSYTISKEIPVATKPKIGRNDPCYCDSGKKYKKCHLNQDQPYVPSKGEVAKMVDWLSDLESFKKEVQRISDEIYGDDHIFDEGDLQAAIETTIYEGQVEGITPIELFLEKAPLIQIELDKYSSWKDNNIFSIFEVMAVDFGKSLTVRDLYTNKEYLVFERLGTYNAEIGMILAARILPNQSNWVFSGGILLPLPTEMGYSLKRIGTSLTESLSQTELLKAIFNKNKPKAEIQQSNLEKIDPKQQPGPMEGMLIREMMFESQSLSINQQKSQEKANKMFDQFAHSWLKTPQPQLENKTPTQVILEERERLGNPNKKLTYKFSVTPAQEDQDDNYIKAVDLMQNKYRYLDALKLFATIDDPFDNLEEPFRFLCNVGVCLIYLGQMELGKKYFQKSLEIKPTYETVQKNLKNFQNSETIEHMRFQGTQRLFFEVLDAGFVLNDESVQNLPFIKDMLKFLAYVVDHSPEITKVRREISFKHVLNINSLFVEPDPQTMEVRGNKKDVIWDYKREVQFPKVNFMHNVFLAGGLIKEEKGKLKISRKGQNFFNLTTEQQFGFIFSTFFSKLNWQALNPPDNLRGDFLSGPTQILQHTGYHLLKSFQIFPNKSFSPHELMNKVLPKTTEDELSTLMLSMMVDKLLLNYLVWMEILEISSNHPKGIPMLFKQSEFRLTSFGNEVIQQADKSIQQNIPKAILSLV